MTAVHPTPFAGTWYPEEPAALHALLDQLFAGSLERTGPTLLPRPLAFVVPHAGLAYSGTVAASVYRGLQDARPARIVLLGFTHQGGPLGVRAPDITAFGTPLGEVAVERGPFPLAAESEVCDHSVEIQLPLLRKAVPGVPLVPLYVGLMSDAERSAAAQTLAGFLRPGDVLLASSDFTHYGRAFGYQPFPAGPGFEQRLFRLDWQIIEAAGSLDPPLFHETLRELRSTMCGHQPVGLLLETLGLLVGDDVFQQVLDYQTSAEIAGDEGHSVSYAALGYFRADSFELDTEGQQALLASARATLRHLRDTGERKAIPPAAVPSLARKAAAFVTLRQEGRLFGCIGTRAAQLSLAEAVPDLTLSAALDDPRFGERDMPEDLDLEISVLTPLRRIRSWRSFRAGRDGACLDHGPRSELLLPQVAAHGPKTAIAFLEALAQKAGLAPSAYRDAKARLSVFRAQVIR